MSNSPWIDKPAFSTCDGKHYAQPKIAKGNQDPKIPMQTDRAVPFVPVSVSKRVSNTTK